MQTYQELQEYVRSSLKEAAKAQTPEERNGLLLKARDLTEAALQLQGRISETLIQPHER